MVLILTKPIDLKVKENSEQIIDKSLKIAVCFFIASAGLWLLAAAFLPTLRLPN